MFKIGDLVQMDNQFSPDRHPPMGTYGIVMGFKINRKRSWEYPVVYWKNKNRAYMSLPTTTRLIARAK